jgi:maleamate amidohydrolase
MKKGVDMEIYEEAHKKIGYGAGRVGWGRSPAVICVDFQRGITDVGAPVGGGEHLRRAVTNTAKLLEVARRKNIPVIYFVVTYREDKKDMGLWPMKLPVLAECKEGSKWVEVSPEIAPAPGDLVMAKKMPSVFFGTGLLNYLVSNGIDTNIITGTVTSGCVRASIIDSFSHGFRTIVVEDCCGDQSEEPHRANLTDVNNRYADVVSLEECIEHIKKM